MIKSVPAFTTGMNHLEPEVYITDRSNEAREPLGDALIDVQPTWDIDRAGSKGRVDIEAHRGVLKPGMWIAPYITITPEVGEVVHQQMGHFRLGRPGHVFDGLLEIETGDASHQQSAYGGDIIDDIAAVRLSETFYTPVRGNVMSDIHTLIKMATAGIMGPNLLVNGSFESEASGWPVASGWSNGGSGSISWGPVPGGFPMPDGSKGWGPVFNASLPADAAAYARQNISLPAGSPYLYLSGLAFPHTTGGYAMWISVIFADENDDDMGDFVDVGSRSQTLPGDQFSRVFGVVPVPDGASIARIFVFAQDKVGMRPSTHRVIWDDIRVGTCTHMPIPDSRINLPPSTATASTRIQTTVGQSIGYEAINADRAAAIGHHAIYTQQDGVITTSPLRDASTATPKRVYQAGDYRFVGLIEIPPSDADVPNHFVSVKEAIEEGADPIFAESFNRNPNDEFSVINTGRVISADVMATQDAVDEAALQAVVDAARDRQSTQEEVRISVIPDPTLTVYDAIQIDDPSRPEVHGTWLIKSLDPGMRPENPTLQIVARRAIGGGS